MTTLKLIANVFYKEVESGGEAGEFERSSCVLDLMLPAQTRKKPFSTVILYHGGGLYGGDKRDGVLQGIARNLAEAGIGVASPNYRLSPKAKYPDYLVDAAHAVRWVRENIGGYGGDGGSLFVSGHSAGGYLASMLAMDERVLGHAGLTTAVLKGAIPISAQVSTHLTIKGERGVPKPLFTPYVDADAPLFHVRGETVPQLYIIGDNDYKGRLEETLYFMGMLKLAGNKVSRMMVVEGRTHGSIAGKMADREDPAMSAMLAFIGEHR
jgi:acetyl esterase/lipase